MSRRIKVAFTRDFDRNLGDLERFSGEHDAADGFRTLLDDLLDVVVPDLERFPAIGADFLARRPQSVQATARIDRLRTRLGDSTTLREYVAGCYLVLYAVGDRQLWLLAIRHHKQLSYDLEAHWVR